MFLSCMATSVFFSFDSLFSSIFPADERRRAADIRAQRQVAGTVADIGVRAARSQAEEARALFASPGWLAYEENLRKLSLASQNADNDIEKFFVDRMEAHKSAVAAQQQRIADARANEATIGSRKNILADELARLKAERPTLSNELSEKRTELEARNRAIDAKRVEAMAEERGAEGTLKAGKGPIYRQRMA
jgi:chromosome segregation ATPase